MTIRTPRDSTMREEGTREARAREWRPPTGLPVPDPIPGWVFRWVMVSTRGEADPTHTDKRFREGWEPVKAEDMPELAASLKRSYEFAGVSRSPDTIQIGGLLLCRMPDSMVAQRNKYYQDYTRRAVEAVENNLMRQSDSRMPIQRPEHSVSFGSGRVN